MKSKIGTIVSNIDELGVGKLSVLPDDEENTVQVNYVSPYSGGEFSGFIAIPEVNSRVIILQPDNTMSWYYMGSIMDPTKNLSFDNSPNIEHQTSLPDPKAYSYSPVPQRYGMSTPLGNKIVLSDLQNSQRMNLGVFLKGMTGKTIAINESPLVDAIMIRNEHGDGIKIQSSGKNSGLAASREIDIQCKGSLTMVSYEGTVNLEVIDGKEINIINKSTKSKAKGEDDLSPGNINIHSYQADINLAVTSEEGSIFIDANGDQGIIQVRSNGSIGLFAKNSIDIRADQGNVNIMAGGVTTVQGSEVQLNPLIPINPLPIQNSYEEMNNG